jgi:hypothetical protein
MGDNSLQDNGHHSNRDLEATMHLGHRWDMPPKGSIMVSRNQTSIYSPSLAYFPVVGWEEGCDYIRGGERERESNADIRDIGQQGPYGPQGSYGPGGYGGGYAPGYGPQGQYLDDRRGGSVGFMETFLASLACCFCLDCLLF